MTLTAAPTRQPGENSRSFAYRFLYDSIMRLDLEPGEQLSEAELSESLNVSRTPIREAILALQGSRLVEILPQRSSCVSRINTDYVEEGVFLRHAVETAVFKEAVKTVTPADLSAIRENLSIQKLRLDEQRWSEYVEADNEFHKLIYQAAKKPWSWSSVTATSTHLTRLRRLQFRADTSTLHKGLEEHSRFFRALEMRDDSGIDRALYYHLTAGYRKVLPFLQQEYPQYFA